MTRIDDVMLMAYVDGEVDADTARQIEHAINSDAGVAERARMFRESASLLRGAYADALHEKVPDRLLTTLNAAAKPVNVVNLPARRGARQVFGGAVAASLATLVVGGAGGYWYVTENRAAVQDGIQTAAAERWLDNVTGFYDIYDAALKKEDRLLVDFKADDIPELQNWFSARLNRPLSVPDLSGQGFRPQGGRLLIINGKPAAQFTYLSDRGELVGLVIAFTTSGYQPAHSVRRHNVNIVHWRNNGYAYAFVGTVEMRLLEQLADKAWRDLGKT